MIPPSSTIGYYEMEEKKRKAKEAEKEAKDAEKEGKKEAKKRKSKAGGESDEDNDDNDLEKSVKKKTPKSKKRRLSSSDEEDNDDDAADKENAGGAAAKKARKSSASSATPSSSSSVSKTVVSFEPPAAIADSIASDVINVKLWAEVKAQSIRGRPKFIEKLTEVFTCVVCQEVAAKPVTSPCGHNSCQDCLKRSFSSEVKSCPVCRGELTEGDCNKVNQHLASVLKALLPGYDYGR